MTDKLPPNLLALFAPRPPLRWVPPCDTEPSQRKTPAITALAPALAQAKEVDEKYKHLEHPPTESWLEKRDRVKLEKEGKLQHLLTDGRKEYNPKDDPNIKGDPLRTLFVGRLSYDATEEDLKKAFSQFGRIQSVRIVENEHAPEDAPIKKKKRGYAFVVFAEEYALKDAYKRADGIIIKGRPCLVDVERGRTVTGWIPRRFGGGLGGRGYTKALSGRPSGAPSGPGEATPEPRGSPEYDLAGPPQPAKSMETVIAPTPLQGLKTNGNLGGFGRGGGYRGGFGGFRDRRGGGGFGGNRHDSRPGFGPSNGFGGPPDGAPSGPRGPRGPRQGSGPGGYGGGSGSAGGRFGDDRRPRNGPSGSNREPVGSRGGAGGTPRGYQDRDRDGGYDDSSRKRRYDGDSYEDPRAKRRY